MAIDVGTARAGEPEFAARPLVVSRQRTVRRLRADRWASRLVVLGGIVIIAAILAILLVIVAEVYPLFKAPTASLVATHAASGASASTFARVPGESAGVDEYREIGYVVTRSGRIEFTSLRAARAIEAAVVPGLGEAAVSAASAGGPGALALGTSDGRVVVLDMKFDVSFRDGRRLVTPAPAFGELALVDPEGRRAVRRLAFAAGGAGPVSVAQVGPAELMLHAVVEKKALVGASRREESTRRIDIGDGEVTALRLDGRGEDLFVGTAAGQLLRYDLRDPGAPSLAETIQGASRPGVAVTALGFLIGDRTLVVGDGAGGVTTWQVLPPPTGGDRRLVRIHIFEGHRGPVIAIEASRRDKGFVTADGSGLVRVHYGTSGRTLLA